MCIYYDYVYIVHVYICFNLKARLFFTNDGENLHCTCYIQLTYNYMSLMNYNNYFIIFSPQSIYMPLYPQFRMPYAHVVMFLTIPALIS